MRRHAIVNLTIFVAAGAVLVAACFERSFNACPGNAPNEINGQCYAQLPDGFTAMPDMTVVKCSGDKDCPADMPVCGAQQSCTTCSPEGASATCSTNHPPTPFCGVAGGCVECNTKDDCVMVQKTCVLSTNKCGPCTANNDCTSGLCDTASGMCAREADLLYVNNGATAGCSESGTGSFNRPFCTVQTGFTNAAASGRTLIVFAGTYPESVVAQPGAGAYMVHAIGVGVTPPAIVPPSSPSAPALSLSNSGTQQLTLTLDNFILRGAVGANGNGVSCSGVSGTRGLTKLILLRSTVTTNAQLGISATNCDITLDQVTLAMNAQGGAFLSSCDFTVENALIRDNGTAGTGAPASAYGGLYWTGTSSRAQIINVTAVNNKNDTGSINPVGIACAGSGTVMFNTVVKGNSGTATGGETGGCSPTYSAYNGASGTGNRDLTLCTSTTQLFVDPANSDYHPLKTGVAPCNVVLVDVGTMQAQPSMVNAPDHDIVGTHRPQGAGFDIGAYEDL